jgi:hypothetical protein
MKIAMPAILFREDYTLFTSNFLKQETIGLCIGECKTLILFPALNAVRMFMKHNDPIEWNMHVLLRTTVAHLTFVNDADDDGIVLTEASS